MPKPKFPYAGDATLKRLLERHGCPAPFHVVRMRFWGEIVSPSLQASPIKTIESFWPNGLPRFVDGEEANTFFQALMSLWNNVARFQDGSLKLQKVDKVDTREALHAARKATRRRASRRLHAWLSFPLASTVLPEFPRSVFWKQDYSSNCNSLSAAR